MMTWHTSPFKPSFASARRGVSIDPTVRGQPAASRHSRGSPRAPGPYHRGGRPSPHREMLTAESFSFVPTPSRQPPWNTFGELLCTSASAQPRQQGPRKNTPEENSKERDGMRAGVSEEAFGQETKSLLSWTREGQGLETDEGKGRNVLLEMSPGRQQAGCGLLLPPVRSAEILS